MQMYLLSLIIINLALLVDSRLYAQDICNPQNPDYCTECRDESKRNFAKCGEIDYRNADFFGQDDYRLSTKRGFPKPDLDTHFNKTVYSVELVTSELNKQDEARFEVFISDSKTSLEKSDSGLVKFTQVDSRTNKRLTWDSSKDYANVCPFFTKDRKIIYKHVPIGNKNFKCFIMDQNGGNKKEISAKEYDKLYKESHDKLGNLTSP